jgi:hypothetical protein
MGVGKRWNKLRSVSKEARPKRALNTAGEHRGVERSLLLRRNLTLDRLFCVRTSFWAGRTSLWGGAGRENLTLGRKRITFD